MVPSLSERQKMEVVRAFMFANQCQCSTSIVVFAYLHSALQVPRRCVPPPLLKSMGENQIIITRSNAENLFLNQRSYLQRYAIPCLLSNVYNSKGTMSEIIITLAAGCLQQPRMIQGLRCGHSSAGISLEQFCYEVLGIVG